MSTVIFPKTNAVIDSKDFRTFMYKFYNELNFVVNGLAVSIVNSTTVQVSAGTCFVGGCYITFPTTQITVPTSTVYIKAILQVDANSKPTGAILTYETTSTVDEFRLLLAEVTTSSSLVTDRRRYRTRMTKELLTSSGSRIQKPGFMFAILFGGGGGGHTSTGANIAGGQGGGVTIDYPLHTMTSIMTWTIGAGGSVGNAGGTTSLSTNEQTLSAAGGEAGRSFANNEARQAPFKFLGYDYTGNIVTHAVPITNIGVIVVNPVAHILAAGAKYVTDSPAIISVPNAVLGTKYGNATSSSVRTSGLLSSWTYGNGGGTNSAGNSGAIILYTYTT